MSGSSTPVRLPSEVSQPVGFFDRFAAGPPWWASRAYFFAFCVLLIVVWAPSFLIIGDVDTWQLIINTDTTIITFLMVALLQNTQTRSDQAVQHKLNAIADGLADLMHHMTEGGDNRDLRQDMLELRDAVGLEEHEGTAKNRGADLGGFGGGDDCAKSLQRQPTSGVVATGPKGIALLRCLEGAAAAFEVSSAAEDWRSLADPAEQGRERIPTPALVRRGRDAAEGQPAGADDRRSDVRGAH